MERLSSLDASFLYRETPTNPLHLGAVFIVELNSKNPDQFFEDVKQILLQRIGILAPLGRKLLEVPLQLGLPFWIQDTNFDIDYHLRKISVPRPIEESQLWDVVAEVMAKPLDRRHPLWEMYFIETLKGNRVAISIKLHHAATDGVSASELAMKLLDTSSSGFLDEDKMIDQDVASKEQVPSRLDLVLNELKPTNDNFPTWLGATRHFLNIAIAMKFKNTSQLEKYPRLFQTCRTSLNVPITSKRKIATSKLVLKDLKQLARHLDATVNDIILGICSGALIRYFELIQEPLSTTLVALVPISFRDMGSPSLGNHLSVMFVPLRTDISDPIERINCIREFTKKEKYRGRLPGFEAVNQITAFTGSVVVNKILQMTTKLSKSKLLPTFFNLIISHVPGSSQNLYFAGNRVESIYPFGPITDGCALNITSFKYRDFIHLGIIADFEAVEHMEEFNSYLAQATQELLNLAQDRS